jgi:ribosomal protein S18 acetylase RimI-like enzyme
LDDLLRIIYRIYRVTDAADLDTVADLFREYACELGVDLTFQGFEEEVADLPGDYGSPKGALLLARSTNGEALGCVALRLLAEPGTCEMKRLYVRPAGRGLGVGRTLASAIITVAAERGYRRMRLDTLSTLRAAIGLYRALGFAPTEAYYETPLAGTLFMAREIDLPRSDLAASSL